MLNRIIKINVILLAFLFIISYFNFVSSIKYKFVNTVASTLSNNTTSNQALGTLR